MKEVHYYRVEFIDGSKKTISSEEYLSLNISTVRNVKCIGNEILMSDEEIKKFMSAIER